MSTPANPLSKFRSYRYYHVLAICDSTATAEQLYTTGLEDPDVWLHTPEDTPGPLGRYGVKEVKLEATAGYQATGVGKYCILINGSTDAQFVITNAKWSSITEAAATPHDKGTSLAVEGSLTISEPRGITFADQLVLCCLALGIDSSVATYVLKTFFVGYNHPDSTQDAPDEGDFPLWVNDIPPLIFVPWDLTATFGPEGGMYQVQFVAMKNGATRLPQYSHVPGGLSISLSDLGNDIGSALTTYQELLNKLYEQYYTCTTDFLKSNAQQTVAFLNAQSENPNLTVEDYLKRFSPVKYTIVVDDAYKGYKITDQPLQFKDKANCDAPANIVAPPQSSIEDTIRNILLKSPDLNKETTDGVPGQNGVTIKYQPKIETTLKSTPTEAGDFTFEVVYKINRYALPRSIATISQNKTGSSEQQLPTESLIQQLSASSTAVAENTIEFDYIFSGLNTDILEFDLKMNLGLSYVQTASLTNSLKSQLEAMQSRSIQVSPNNPSVRFGKPLTVPIFFGTHIKTPQFFNTQQPSSKSKTSWTIDAQASLEMQDVTMKITGNYQLLSSINKNALPSSLSIDQLERLSILNDSPAATNTSQFLAEYKNWGYFPAFAAVNIYMPRNNDDAKLFEQAQGPFDQESSPQGFTKRFWFQGLYYVVAIENEFDNGVFTQTLSMLAIPQNLQDLLGSDTPNISKYIKSCYDDQVGCVNRGTVVSGLRKLENNMVAPSAVAIPNAPPNQPDATTEAAPTTSNDINSVLAMNNDLNNVRGWKVQNKKFPGGAPEESKAAIIKAARDVGIDPVLLARVSSYETAYTFDPTIPGRGASGNVVGLGLFQFIPGTWLEFAGAKRNVLAPLGLNITSNNNLPPNFYDLRKNPEYAARAGAIYVRETLTRAQSFGVAPTIGTVYIQYVAGPGGGGKILSEIGQGRGSQVIPPDYNLGGGLTWSKFIKNNPTFASAVTFQGALDRAEKAMADTLVSGVPIVQSTYAAPPTSTPIPSNPLTQQQAQLNVKSILGRQRPCVIENVRKNDPKKDPCANKDSGASGNTNEQLPGEAGGRPDDGNIIAP